MYQVIDTIRYDENLLNRFPELKSEFGGGLFVILDPNQVRSAPFQAGDPVTIHRPDGTQIQRIVGAIELSAGSVVGVYFSGMDQSEIPRLAKIELDSRSNERRILGSMPGSVKYVAPDFNAPLDDFGEYM